MIRAIPNTTRTALLAVGIGVFVGAFGGVAPGSGTRGRLGKALGIAAVAYGFVLVLGVAGGGTDPLRPLAGFGHAGVATSTAYNLVIEAHS